MEFFIIMNDQQQGPFSVEQLANLNIMPDTPVWCEGMDDWTTANNVAELQHLVAYAPRVDDGANATAGTAKSTSRPPKWTSRPTYEDRAENMSYAQYSTPQEPAAKPRKSRTSLWVTLIVLGVLAIILAITNPSKEDHCRAITKVSHTWVNETVEDLGGTGIIGGVIKIGSSQLIRNLVDKIVDVDNYVLFSMGYIDTGAEKSRVSFGIMGHVFTFDKNLIDKKLEEAFGNSVKDMVNIGGLFSDDESDNSNDVIPPSEQNDEDEVTAEDRAGSAFDMPDEVDTLMKKGAKLAAKEGAKLLDKAIDEMFKDDDKK